MYTTPTERQQHRQVSKQRFDRHGFELVVFSWSERWRKAILIGLGLALAMFVVSTTGLASLSEASPDLALGLGVEAPSSLVERADDELARYRLAVGTATQSGASNSERIEQLAKQALQADVFSAASWRILGELSGSRGDRLLAASYMHAALALNLHESPAAYWLLTDSVRQRDFVAAIRYADILLRTRSGSAAELAPVLAHVAENEAGRRALAQLLATDPPWRRTVLDLLPQYSTDLRAPYLLLAALKDGAHPPQSSEMKLYLEYLCRHGLYDFAYSVWLQLLPAERLAETSLLNNGGFDLATSALPFDWTWSKGAGASVAIESAPDRTGWALHVEFGIGRIAFGGVRQVTVLGPGSYRLSGQYLGDMQAARGLVWRVQCASPQASQLAQTDMFTKPSAAWSTFSIDFNVPANTCGGQIVGLFLDARLREERLLSGSLWFDNLQITPLTGDEASRLSPGTLARSGSGIF